MLNLIVCTQTRVKAEDMELMAFVVEVSCRCALADTAQALQALSRGASLHIAARCMLTVTVRQQCSRCSQRPAIGPISSPDRER